MYLIVMVCESFNLIKMAHNRAIRFTSVNMAVKFCFHKIMSLVHRSKYEISSDDFDVTYTLKIITKKNFSNVKDSYSIQNSRIFLAQVSPYFATRYFCWLLPESSGG
jgi:hypothetical protein